MRLLLVRHGQTYSNLTHALDTEAPGAGLTAWGTRQAEAAASRLETLPISAVHASNLMRTQQTAAPLAQRLGLSVCVHEGLREARAGELEMRADDDAVRTYLKTYLAWINGDLAARMPGAESGHEVVARVDEVVGQFEGDDESIVAAFGHGATIRAWCAARVCNLDSDYIAKHPLENCGTVLLRRCAGRAAWAVEIWQDEAVGGLAVDLLRARASRMPASP